MEDTAIIRLFFHRDERAIQETDKSYGKKLFALANRILRIPEDAEESVSDTYWKTWESIPPQRPSYFFAYLAKICRNAALGRLDWRNAARRKAEVVSLTREMEDCIPDHRAMEQTDRELESLLNQFLGTISQENRQIFMRRYWYMDSIADIASACGMTGSMVKSRLHRTRGKLRTFLEGEGVYL